MVRAILVLIGIAVLILAALMALGIVSLNQTQQGSLPKIQVEGGKAPEFKADVGEVRLGTEEKTVEVPKLEVEKADDPNLQNAN